MRRNRSSAPRFFVGIENHDVVKSIVTHENNDDIKTAAALFDTMVRTRKSAQIWVQSAVNFTHKDMFQEAGVCYLIAAGIALDKEMTLHAKQNFKSASDCFRHRSLDNDRADACLEKIKAFNL